MKLFPWFVPVFAGLALVVFLLYSPTFSVGLINDDFIEVGARYFDAQDSLSPPDLGVWAQRFVTRSLIDPVTDLSIFRPWRQVIFVADYFVWGVEPVGYHLTNILLFILLCWVVVLLSWRLTKSRPAAALAGLLYAVQTVHVAPVASISSRGHLLAALFVALCVLFYILPRSRRNLAISWLMCALAIGSKETAWATPLLLLAYEVIYHREGLRRELPGLVRRQLAFWLLPAIVIAFRLLTAGPGVGGPFKLGDWDWLYQVQGYTLFAVRPFLLDINEIQTALVLGSLILLGIVYRRRQAVVFGLLWVPLMMPLTLLFPPTERYFATPSIGLALALAPILAQPLDAASRWANPARAVGLLLAAGLVIGFGIGTLNRNNDYLNLSRVTQRTLSQLQTLQPKLPSGSALTFVGLHIPVRGGILFIATRQLEYAVQMLYGDRSLHVTLADTFPPTLAVPDKTFFFEYADSRLTERTDLVTALQTRRRCSDSPDRTISWNFTKDAEGWEPWSQIQAVSTGAEAYTFRTLGTDPFMASPFIQVRPQELRNIKIQMAARAATPTFTAELFWQTTDMDDFSGQARASFEVNADNALHIYTIPLDVRGNAPLARLRFDPSDTPAEIELARITLRCK